MGLLLNAVRGALSPLRPSPALSTFTNTPCPARWLFRAHPRRENLTPTKPTPNTMKNYSRAVFLSRILTVAGAGAILSFSGCANKDDSDASSQKKKATKDDIADIAIPAGLTLQEVRLAIVAAAISYGPSYDRTVKIADNLKALSVAK